MMKNVTNEFAEYIDNEQICMISGVPCKCGIPECDKCFEPQKNNENRLRNILDDLSSKVDVEYIY